MNYNIKTSLSTRSSSEEVQIENQFISSMKLFNEIFDSSSGICSIINDNRQIIYTNIDFLKYLGLSSIETILGKRPGEVISCIHSADTPLGCGTSYACRYCGILSAILESQRTKEKTINESRISTYKDGAFGSLDLKTTCTPISLSDKQYYILFLQDISNEKRRLVLERIFFHDLINTIGGLNGILKILKEENDSNEKEKLINLSEEISGELLEEISLHRQIHAAEFGNLTVTIEKLNSNEFLYSTINKIKSHEVAKNKQIQFHCETPEINFETDRILFQKVIINLLKNALEASQDNKVIVLGIKDKEDKIEFWVKNEGIIPENVQFQLFQRSFSTKGNDRGIGTYSVKLLCENYLKGKVSFVSNETHQTIFSVELNKKWHE
jgi:signal transduction histidine kinase